MKSKDHELVASLRSEFEARIDVLEDFFALYDDDTLEDVVAHYLARPELADQVAARGQRLVQRHHTYGNRVDQLLAQVASRTPAREARS